MSFAIRGQGWKGGEAQLPMRSAPKSAHCNRFDSPLPKTRVPAAGEEECPKAVERRLPIAARTDPGHRGKELPLGADRKHLSVLPDVLHLRSGTAVRRFMRIRDQAF